MPKKKEGPKKKLWRLTSEYVRRSEALSRSREMERHGQSGDPDLGECVTCGLVRPWRELQAGHFIPRAQGLATYFDLRNIHTQCYRCNINLGGNGAEYYPYMLQKYGEDTVNELRSLSRTTKKYYKSDYESMIEDLEQKLRELDGES